MKTMTRKSKAAFALLGLTPLVAFAENAPVVPSAGTLLQQSLQTAPQPISTINTGLNVEQPDGTKLPDGGTFEVKTIQISGNTLVDSDTLTNLLGDFKGQSVSLGQLGAGVDRITAYYRARGYTVARALVPSQTIRDGVVRVHVIEGAYDQVRLENHSLVRDSLLASALASLKEGQVIEQRALDRSLLLMSDLPGAVVNATLAPGREMGTSDLLVEAGASPEMQGTLLLDNYGNQYSGRMRLGADLSRVGLMGNGDVLNARLQSTGKGLRYGRLSYDTYIPGVGNGTHFGTAYSGLRYKLGGRVAELDIHGDATEGNAWIARPFLRSRATNVYGAVEYRRKQLRDVIGATGQHNERRVNNWDLTLRGDHRDSWLAAGLENTNSFSVALTRGVVHFVDMRSGDMYSGDVHAGDAHSGIEQANGADAITARTEGRFQKWTVKGSRLQRIDANNAVYFALGAQWANKNLDSSEKFETGGAFAVRAYDGGVLSADSAMVENVEWRREFGTWWGGWMQGLAFLDHEYVKVNEVPWVAGPNTARLIGGGLGLNWFGPQQWAVKVALAKPLGAAPELLTVRQSGRIWFDIGRAF